MLNRFIARCLLAAAGFLAAVPAFAARFARSGGVPQLWIYRENDHYFGPELARRMHAAFVAAGGRAEFVQAPPAGADGHGYFTRAVRDWAPRVEEFLRLAGAIAGP